MRSAVLQEDAVISNFKNIQSLDWGALADLADLADLAVVLLPSFGCYLLSAS